MDQDEARRLFAGRWDRLATFGVKRQGDQEFNFTRETFAQWVENFRKMYVGRRIPYDFEHKALVAAENEQPVQALAFGTAVCAIQSGEVYAMAAHDPALPQPDPAQLLAEIREQYPSDPDSDGAWVYRGDVTPLGVQTLPNLEQLSPLFKDEDANEAGEPIGSRLMTASVVAVAHQDRTVLNLPPEARALRTSGPQAALGALAKAQDKERIRRFLTDQKSGLSAVVAGLRKARAGARMSKAAGFKYVYNPVTDAEDTTGIRMMLRSVKGDARSRLIEDGGRKWKELGGVGLDSQDSPNFRALYRQWFDWFAEHVQATARAEYQKQMGAAGAFSGAKSMNEQDKPVGMTDEEYMGKLGAFMAEDKDEDKALAAYMADTEDPPALRKAMAAFRVGRMGAGGDLVIKHEEEGEKPPGVLSQNDSSLHQPGKPEGVMSAIVTGLSARVKAQDAEIARLQEKERQRDVAAFSAWAGKRLDPAAAQKVLDECGGDPARAQRMIEALGLPESKGALSQQIRGGGAGSTVGAGAAWGGNVPPIGLSAGNAAREYAKKHNVTLPEAYRALGATYDKETV